MIRFKTHPNYTEATVAFRVAQIITGQADQQGPPWHAERDNKWQIDPGNNWFMSKVGENEYELRFRYAHNRENRLADALAQASPFLTFLFGGDLTPEESS